MKLLKRESKDVRLVSVHQPLCTAEPEELSVSGLAGLQNSQETPPVRGQNISIWVFLIVWFLTEAHSSL